MSTEILFNLGLNHVPALLLSAIPALVTVACIFYFSRFPEYKVNQVYILYMFGILAWQLNDCMARMSLTEQTARAWDQLLSVGWLFQFPSSIQWALLLAEKKNTGRNLWINILIYLPIFIVAVGLCAGVVERPFVYSEFWGWVPTYRSLHSLLGLSMVIVVVQIFLTTVILLTFVKRNQATPRSRSISKSIFIGYTLPAIIAVFTQCVHPLFLNHPPIPIASTLMLTIVLVIFEIKAYNLYIISETLDSEGVTNLIPEAILVLTPDYGITYLNAHAKRICGISANSLTSVKELFPNDTEDRFVNEVIKPGFLYNQPYHSEFSFVNGKDEKVYWDVATYPIHRSGKFDSLLAVCRDVSERILLAEAKLSALRSQMNPHFIFNSLNSVQHFIYQNKREDAQTFLSNFSQLIRKILDNSRQSEIALTEELSTIELYLLLEKARFGDRLDFVLNISSALDTDNILVPPMFIQPFIENSIVHGIAAKQNGGTVRVEVFSEDEILVCVVQDDGIGRGSSNKLKRKAEGNRVSHAMKIIENRVSLLNQHRNSAVKVQVHDLMTDNDVPAGTRVEIRIPILERF